MERRAPGPLALRRLAEGCESEPYRHLHIEPCAVTIGAEVGGVDLSRPLEDEVFEELDRALLEWKVLFFRDQPLEVGAHAGFAARWGPLFDDQLVPTHQENPVDNLVVFERNEQTVGLENHWHCDGTFRREPPMGTVLRAIEVPAVGGDTLFADMAAAYDALPDGLKARLEGLMAVHDWSLGYADKYADRLDALRAEVPPAEHPVVRRHPVTGRRTLFVNRFFTREICGLPAPESEALLERLCAQAELPELQCRFRWRPGSMAFWDNQAVQHYGASDYWPQRRVMARASIAHRHPAS